MTRHPSSRKPFAVLLASIAALATGHLQAQTSWLGDGANGNWSDPLNWSANAPGPTNRTVVFGNAFTGSPAGANLIASNNDLVGFNGLSLTFENTPSLPACTVAGNGFTLSASGPTAPVLVNNSAALQTFNLTGALNFSGGAAGYGEINAASGDLAFGAGTTINATGDLRLISGAARSLTINGPVSGGQLIKSGAGAATLAGVNTYSGGTVVSQGTLFGNTQDAIGTGTLTLGDANTGSANVIYVHQSPTVVSLAKNLVVSAEAHGLVQLRWTKGWYGSPGAAYDQQNDLTFTLNRALNFNAGVGSDQIAPFISGPGAGAGNVTITVDGGNVTWTASLGPAGVRVSDFAGNVRITGNTFASIQNRTYQGGATAATHANGVIPDASTLIVDAGSTYRNVWGSETVAFIAGTGTVSTYVGGAPAGGLVLAGDASTPTTSPTSLGFATFEGTLSTIDSLRKTGTGTQELRGAGISYTPVTNLDRGTLRLSNTTAFNSNVILGGTLNPTLQLNAPETGDAWTFSKVISGGSATARLEKTGLGTVTLSGTQTVTGVTEVIAGTLNLTGSLTNSTLTIDGGATLTGTGHVGGLLSVQSGGLLSPGTNGGTLFADAALTLASGSSLRFDLTGTNPTIGAGLNDTFAVLGALVLDGSLTVNDLVAGSFTTAALGTKWQLFSYTGSLTNNGLDFGTMPALAPGRSFAVDTSTAGQVNLTVVPEPGTAFSLVGGLGALAAFRRRRR